MEDVFIPVVESSMVYACHYCKAAGRSTVTSKDLEYGLKYATRVILGKKIGSIFPEIYDESESDEDVDPVEIVDDDDEPFKRYEGSDEVFTEMNRVYDEWSEWNPETPAEVLLRNAIEKMANSAN